MSHGYAHRRATAKKQRREMAADEAGSAEHRDAVGHRFDPVGATSVAEVMDRFGTLIPASAATEQLGNVAEAGAAPNAPKASNPRLTADDRVLKPDVRHLGFMVFPP
ncbi:MAG: hypothetical protein JO227_10460 [Acetobacteraceae bacterium]|nr:hypothetical protein [Acetobacteraceae bacterium]